MFLLLCFLSITVYSFQCTSGGDNEIRTHDPLLARQVLSQLSYTPILRFLSIAFELRKLNSETYFNFFSSSFPQLT